MIVERKILTLLRNGVPQADAVLMRNVDQGTGMKIGQDSATKVATRMTTALERRRESSAGAVTRYQRPPGGGARS